MSDDTKVLVLREKKHVMILIKFLTFKQNLFRHPAKTFITFNDTLAKTKESEHHNLYMRMYEKSL